MSIAIAQEFDTADVLAPEQPLTLDASGLSRDSLQSLLVKSLLITVCSSSWLLISAGFTVRKWWDRGSAVPMRRRRSGWCCR